jgi:hypothetical protein
LREGVHVAGIFDKDGCMIRWVLFSKILSVWFPRVQVIFWIDLLIFIGHEGGYWRKGFWEILSWGKVRVYRTLIHIYKITTN